MNSYPEIHTKRKIEIVEQYFWVKQYPTTEPIITAREYEFVMSLYKKHDIIIAKDLVAELKSQLRDEKLNSLI